MKHIILIGYNRDYKYFHFSDSKTNKNWILQYDTPFESALAYAIGYVDALIRCGENYDGIIRFTDEIENLDDDLRLCIITESEFQKIREELKWKYIENIKPKTYIGHMN